ncbi:MAG TPA: methyltransferase domain-containing protein [Sphingomicrobium sp.]|jgi:predicted methyltransferase|nr:methyltransferase domain-containing protein [Sphingomicrobium sp.]
MIRRAVAWILMTSVAVPLAAQGTGEPAKPAAAQVAPMDAALAAPTRTPANVARDKYRHPKETLTFFGVQPNQTVVELWPGGGWYTEVLAPYLASGGALYVVPPAGSYDQRIRTKIASNPVYGSVQVATFTSGQPTSIAAGSADVVLTFRNVHSWLDEEKPIADQVFAEAFRMLKPGGTLGVVEHRLPEEADDARQMTSGYVKVSTVRRLAEAAGFNFVESSEINANPKDTKDYPEGVWTLPPTLELGDKDREKYLAIGESDRMTLKFVKPN